MYEMARAPLRTTGSRTRKDTKGAVNTGQGSNNAALNTVAGQGVLGTGAMGEAAGPMTEKLEGTGAGATGLGKDALGKGAVTTRGISEEETHRLTSLPKGAAMQGLS